MEVELGGERVVLLPDRAAWLPAHATLLVADAHLGKAASFRRLGVPVPEASTDGTLARLDATIAATGARRIVFLGDLLHAARGRGPVLDAALQAWRSRQAGLDLVLVRGNHDRKAGDPPPAWGLLAVAEPLRLGGLALRHHPQPEPGAYVLAGHVHPAAIVGGPAHQRLRLPCFWLGAEVGVLPAFGEFTGGRVVEPEAGDRVFVAGGERVWALRG